MSRRLTTGAAPDSPLTDAMYRVDPPIHDHIRLSATLVEQIDLVAKMVVSDGERIVELLGASSNGESPRMGHSLDREQQAALHRHLDELLSRLDATLRVDGDLLDTAGEIPPRATCSVELTAAVVLHVYLKLWSINRLTGFALEHGVQLRVG